MKPWRVAFLAFIALAGCSGRDASLDRIAPVDAGIEAARNEGTAAAPGDASSIADAGTRTAPVDASVVDAVVDASAPSPVDASAAADVTVRGADAAGPSADAGAPPDALLGCYLQGIVYCPVGTWCPLGTCPDGITPYGCTCNADGTTTCNLDCPP